MPLPRARGFPRLVMLNYLIPAGVALAYATPE
jgi:hypothetical protein